MARRGPERYRWHTCEVCGKRTYHYRKGAKAIIKLKRAEEGLREYPACDDRYWHVGHMPEAVRRGSWTRREIFG